MKRIICYSLLPAVFFSCMYSLHAQDPEWKIFTRENTGLPGIDIKSIVVDDFNNIWSGTLGGGLVKFDGNVWKVFTEENSWLPSNYIFTLARDLSGNIWIGTGLEYGFAKFDGKNWRVYNPDNSQIPATEIYSIVFDSDNNMWIGTFGSGLIKIKGLSVLNDPEWTFYNTENSDIPDNKINGLTIDSTGLLWIGTKEGGLVKFDGNTFTTYNSTNSDLPANHIKTLAIDIYNHVWIGMSSDGLIKYDGTDWTFFNSSNSGLQSDEITSLAVSKNNDLWIGTSDGFFRYNDDEGVIHSEKEYVPISSTVMADNGILWAGSSGGVLFKFDGNNWNHYSPENTGLPFNEVRVVKTGAYGNIWIGLSEGLVKFNGICWCNYQPSNSDLPGYNVRDITIDEEGNTWIGTENGLAMIPALDLPDQHWSIYNTDNSTLPTNSIRRLYYGNRNLRIGTTLGLTRFDGDTWVTFNTDNSQLSHNDIRSIVMDNDNNIWIGTYGGGLCKIPALSLNDPDWTVFNTDNSVLPDNMVFALEADSSGNIWIGTAYSGLLKFDGSNFQIYDTDNSGLPDNHIESLKLDDDENLWIGMRYGSVAKFNGTDWTVYDPDNSLLSGDAVYSIDTDKYGNIWIATDGGGVAVCNDDQVSIERYHILSGHIYCDNGNAPLNKSMIELYKDAGEPHVDQLILDGTNGYQFTGMESGMYTIKVIPDTITYPETMPTWLGYKLTGADAKYVIMMYEDIIGKDITIIQRPPAGSGTGTVTGTLCFDETGQKKITTLKTSEAQGTPVSDCYVYLYDSLNITLKAFDITSSEGTFVFKNLEAGEYEFLADYRGIPMNASNPALTISSTNDSIHITAVADADKIALEVEQVSHVAALLKGTLEVYPVPVKENLTITFRDIQGASIENISLIDLNGKILYDHTLPVLNGSNTVVDMHRFPPGIYLLRVRGKDACRHIKVVKK